jgi:hypothetical protein
MTQVTLKDKSYSEDIVKKLGHLDKAVSILSQCPDCYEKFKLAVKEDNNDEALQV